MDKHTAEVAAAFEKLYAKSPVIVQAPGRVNLIGEHTDYNDGFVMPAAIQFCTVVAIAPRSDNRLRIHSKNFSESVVYPLDQLPASPRRHWSDYPIGVARMLQQQGTSLRGADLLIDGTVPLGAGLSSSASIEVAVCRALLEVNGAQLDTISTAKLCQRAENEYVGARCGIMDQFVSVHARKNHALLLDCRSLQFRNLPLPESVRLVLCNSMVKHALAGGEYNQRRAECEEAARFFAAKRSGVNALRDVSPQEFSRYADELPELVRKRARHVIAENARVEQAAYALEHHDLAAFGRLMKESHASLRDDFQVSCKELDALVDLATQLGGVLGARMTGGGFGGCTINLVQDSQVEPFTAAMRQGYEQSTGITPEIYVCTAEAGAGRLQ